MTTEKNNYTKILGIDSSTQGVAYTLIEDGKPSLAGMIDLTKFKTIQDKLTFISHNFTAVLQVSRPDYIFIEMPIFVKNPDTARKLSFVAGALMVVAAQNYIDTELVEPATWKAFTKYKNITTKMQTSAVNHLGKTEGKKFCDRLRKEQTSRALQQTFPEWNFKYDDHNKVDSCAIALYGTHKLVSPVTFPEKLNLFTPEELNILGLQGG